MHVYEPSMHMEIAHWDMMQSKHAGMVSTVVEEGREAQSQPPTLSFKQI